MINDTLHIALHFYCHEVLLYTIGFDAFFREIFSGLYFISSMDKLNSSESIHEHQGGSRAHLNTQSALSFLKVTKCETMIFPDL